MAETTARNLQKKLGYKKWDNFHNVINKAIQISKHNKDVYINQIKSPSKIGSNAVRYIIDYTINNNGVDLLKRMTGASKPTSNYSIRNETFYISLLKKYYECKKFKFDFQFRVDKYLFDCKIGDVLFEFDEPHHSNTKQSAIDNLKDICAKENGYKIVRANCNDDIIDIIIRINHII